MNLVQKSVKKARAREAHRKQEFKECPECTNLSYVDAKRCWVCGKEFSDE